MKKTSLLMMLLVTLTIFSGCEKEPTQSETIKKGETINDLEVFKPSNKVVVENGMLSFKSKIAFEVTKREIAMADRRSVDLWEKSLGIKTPASIFNAVILAEDSISNYFMGLPEKEQEYWLSIPQPHSNIYNQALSQKIICLLPDGDGGHYFDLNYYDKTITNLINLEGFVKVENQIYQYTDKSIKIIQDGDPQKIGLIKEINKNFNGNNMVVNIYGNNRLKNAQMETSFNWTQEMPFYQFEKNWKGSYQKRVRVWIDGHSEPAGTYERDNCYEYVNCTFVLRAEAQKKNFWGNWVYGDYWPTLTYNAEWYYEYWTYIGVSYGCGLYDNNNHYVDSGKPTSPYSNTSQVNNAFYELTPHGVWRSSPIFFSRPFSVHGTITWSLGPLTNQTYTW
jgi:hypothetical protein